MERILSFLFLVALIRFLILIVRKKNLSVSKAFKSSAITFFASSGYLLAIQENLKYYHHAISKIPVLHLLVPIKEIGVDNALAIVSDPTIFTIVTNYLSNYISFFVFFAVYFFIIKNGKKLNIDYFIRYNVMHSILIMLLQVPLTFLYVECVQYLTLNRMLKMFLQDFAQGIIIFNFVVIFYAMFYAMTNRYAYVPLVTDASKLHIGKA
jgi:hypothetical protein